MAWNDGGRLELQPSSQPAQLPRLPSSNIPRRLSLATEPPPVEAAPQPVDDAPAITIYDAAGQMTEAFLEAVSDDLSNAGNPATRAWLRTPAVIKDWRIALVRLQGEAYAARTRIDTTLKDMRIEDAPDDVRARFREEKEAMIAERRELTAYLLSFSARFAEIKALQKAWSSQLVEEAERHAANGLQRGLAYALKRDERIINLEESVSFWRGQAGTLVEAIETALAADPPLDRATLEAALAAFRDQTTPANKKRAKQGDG